MANVDIMDGARQGLDRSGRILTWLSGIVGALLGVPTLMLGCFALALGSSQPVEYGAGLGCHSEGCLDQFKGAGLIGVGFAVVVLMLIMLAVASTRRSLAAAAGIGLLVAAGLVVYALSAIGSGDSGASAIVLFVMAVIIGTLGAGSWMRFRARPARP